MLAYLALFAALLMQPWQREPASTAADARPSRPAAREGRDGREVAAESDIRSPAKQVRAGLSAEAPDEALRQESTRLAQRQAPIADDENDEASSSLDEASREVVARTLETAIERVRMDRGIPIAAGLVEAMLDAGHVRVIVHQAADLPDLEPRLDGARHGEVRYFRNIPYAAIEVGPEALLTLIESGDVQGIERDAIHRPSLTDTVPLINADDMVAAGHDGDGYAIALLDTGVDLTHPFYADRLIDEACFSAGADCPNNRITQLGAGAGAPCQFPECNHGTAVAGIALGADAGAGRFGVARSASLISIQVFSDIPGSGTGAYTSDLIAALEHVYGLRLFYTIAAANMSLGDKGHGTQPACDAANTATKAVIDLLRGVGIATVVSAGNQGLTNQVNAPACISTAVSVGATDRNDVVPSYSNSDDFLSLLAPGDLVVTSNVGGGTALASGTSMATPHVSGAWALMLDAVPGSSVHEILYSLQASGVAVEDGRNSVTTARIDIEAALDYLRNGDIPPEAAGIAGTPIASTPDCGLVGLELLVPLLVTGRWRQKRRARARHH
jgi:hypothetical protein